MIAIAGNPRSGTSLMMRCFVDGIGKDRIVGDEFPQEKRFAEQEKQQEDESDQHFLTRKYIFDKYPENSQEARDKMKDMNPNGFWECPFTVQGIGYSPGLKDLFDQMDNEDKDNSLVIKLVNSGLFASDPKYIDKVVYMVRHPRNIAKSQEKLKRSQKFKLKDGREIDLFEDVVVHDPQFYIQSTTQFAKWRIDNPDIPVMFVHYDDMIEKPSEILPKIAEFTGIPEVVAGLDVINPKLRRSLEDPEKESDLWEEAELIHDLLTKEDFQAILDLREDRTSPFAKRNLNYICTRIRAAVNYHNCIACRKELNQEFIASGKKRAEANGWDWWNEPCVFECGFDPDDENPKTVEESIKTNHWIAYNNGKK